MNVSRQVRRQRERLALKGRTDAPPSYLLGNKIPKRHKPYTPEQLMARAVERLERRKAAGLVRSLFFGGA